MRLVQSVMVVVRGLTMALFLTMHLAFAASLIALQASPATAADSEIGGAGLHVAQFGLLSAERKPQALVQDKPGAIQARQGASLFEAQGAPEEAFSFDAKEAVGLIFRVRGAFGEMLSSASGFPDRAMITLRAAGPQGGILWMSFAFGLLLAALLFGHVAGRLFSNWARTKAAGVYQRTPENRADRIAFLFARAIIMAFETFVFTIVAALIILLFDNGVEAVRQTALTGLAVVVLFRFVRILLLNLLAPHLPDHRVLPLCDSDAVGVYRGLIAIFAISAVALAGAWWMQGLGIDPIASNLSFTVGSGIAALGLCIVSIAYRRGVADAIRGGGPLNEIPGWRRLLASLWHAVAVVYFILAWLVATVERLLQDDSAGGLVGAPIWALIAVAVSYAVLLLLIDRVLLPRLDTLSMQAKRRDELAQLEEMKSGEVDPEADAAQAAAEAIAAEGLRAPYRNLLERGAAIVTALAGLYLLLWRWRVPLAGDSSVLARGMEVFIVGFLGYMAYSAVRITIDRKIEDERPEDGVEHSEMEIGGTGESRLATLLPIFKNFLLITIVVIASMIALSELGVDIGPLFAGAGVIGLAVGFGAQTLIRDIFSGAFFLIDDAFRKGEYVDIGDVKGSIEKISIRSMQLRHHRGALHTVPFGEIKHVTNYSRDWAIMKLAFRVTYDTDVERVRKLIKKLGQELLEDPEYGPMFLDPLKSQGVLAMEDSAMIVRVKFKTRPGEQFLIRKKVYSSIRELFEREGIHFAHREVTVRVAHDEDEGNGKLTRAETEAAAGAVLPVVEEQQATASHADKM